MCNVQRFVPRLPESKDRAKRSGVPVNPGKYLGMSGLQEHPSGGAGGHGVRTRCSLQRLRSHFRHGGDSLLRLTESAHVSGLSRSGTSTVTRMLHDEAYIGTMYCNRHESVSCDPRSTPRRRPTRL